MIDRSKLSPANQEALMRLEELYGQGLKINSGHRTREKNAAVGGAQRKRR